MRLHCCFRRICISRNDYCYITEWEFNNILLLCKRYHRQSRDTDPTAVQSRGTPAQPAYTLGRRLVGLGAVIPSIPATLLAPAGL